MVFLFISVLVYSRYFSMVCTNVDLGTAPITASIFCPFLKIMTVGILRIPYSVATVGLSSVFNLTCRFNNIIIERLFLFLSKNKISSAAAAKIREREIKQLQLLYMLSYTHRSQLITVFSCQFINNGGNHSARSTPGCPEIHEHRHWGFENKLLPGIIVHSTCIKIASHLVHRHRV
jgi:hypothetical protein